MENTGTDRLSPFLAASAALHGGLFVLVIFGPALWPAGHQEQWGSNTDKGVRVGVVSSLPGISLPSPAVVTESAKPNDSKTLNPAETAPKPVVKAPVKADVQIPSRNAKKNSKKEPPPTAAKPTKAPTKADVVPPPTAVASNAIPGAGGQIALPYGQSGGGSGPATFGDGNFGLRFPEYVTNMTRAIELSWRDTLASVPRGASPRVYVKFTLNKAGKASDLEVAESSGSVALDNSAQRAVLAAKIPPLPAGYSGSSVDVRFYFEYKR